MRFIPGRRLLTLGVATIIGLGLMSACAPGPDAVPGCHAHAVAPVYRIMDSSSNQMTLWGGILASSSNLPVPPTSLEDIANQTSFLTACPQTSGFYGVDLHYQERNPDGTFGPESGTINSGQYLVSFPAAHIGFLPGHSYRTVARVYLRDASGSGSGSLVSVAYSSVSTAPSP